MVTVSISLFSGLWSAPSTSDSRYFFSEIIGPSDFPSNPSGWSKALYRQKLAIREPSLFPAKRLGLAASEYLERKTKILEKYWLRFAFYSL
jgi:hypothetical protein